ncbi:hypothetical protein AB0L54_36815, partial [Streptomyces sp. NPDC052196]|uniref:hypothetical protein n=1 Tax=Streptomyces sp. NPDC052196 TaxID=3156691 RepID=UPI00342841C6
MRRSVTRAPGGFARCPARQAPGSLLGRRADPFDPVELLVPAVVEAVGPRVRLARTMRWATVDSR